MTMIKSARTNVIVAVAFLITGCPSVDQSQNAKTVQRDNKVASQETNEQTTRGILLDRANSGDSDAALALYALIGTEANFLSEQANAKTYASLREEKMNESLRWLKQAAEQKNPAATALYGRLYYTGFGSDDGKRDIDQAIKWYEIAATQGCIKAQLDLGKILAFNDERKNPTKGFKLLLNAAKQGYPIAQRDLSTCYVKGIGTPKNLTESYAWLATWELREGSYPSVDRFVEDHQNELTPDQIAKGQELATKYHELYAPDGKY